MIILNIYHLDLFANMDQGYNYDVKTLIKSNKITTLQKVFTKQ